MLGGQTINWKIIIPQKFSHRSESFEPHSRLPSLGVWQWEEESGFEGQQSLIAGVPQDWGKQNLHSWRVNTGPCAHQDPGEKTVTS